MERSATKIGPAAKIAWLWASPTCVKATIEIRICEKSMSPRRICRKGLLVLTAARNPPLDRIARMTAKATKAQ